AEHAQAIAKEIHFAAFVVVPAHRNFAQTQSGLTSEIEQFDVETKSIDLGFRDYWPANIEAERFEPALRVPKWKTGSDADNQIENTAALFATPWLPIADQPPVQSAGTKRDIHFASHDGFN